jgi:hypothetical protein
MMKGKRPSDGTASKSSKKMRTTSPNRRSKRTGKGVGGAAEQLKRVGDSIAPGPKKNPDPFATEVCNPMAPESLATKKVTTVLFMSH